MNLYIGPMFSGKTTALLNSVDDESIVIDFEKDTFCRRSFVYSHDNNSKMCINMSHLDTLFLTEYYKEGSFGKYKKILINEAQFFPDLHEFIKTIETYDIRVEVYGLDGDFERKPFGEILSIIPYCNHVTKFIGNCECGGVSLFSKRITENREQYLLDSTAYRPVCRNCYLN